ncbi:hypothetical protein Shewmr4_0050 [Shewanella sp. MR-4]|uniref:hypothetical protein n=1 Tax=Shewanella sp. (strain MR-4) TaxID=60480 RepID=UPI00005E60E4|nr:hypothetical protein [Shewanella sp. MR-4]ABI37131.1 hypothetical protein Shewmr4_0050 [Shewanella sp. MR-4]
MNTNKPLRFFDFSSADNPLVEIQRRLGSQQSRYVSKYLNFLGAKKVLVEDNYFDRDYLNEFSAFYSLSAKGYPNICQRLHFFSTMRLDRELFVSAVGGDESAIDELQNGYLGFIVVRPITDSPFGRTVLKWYPDQTPGTPRVTQPSRDYVCNVAGLEFCVHGLAWQQQDSGVAACATIGIWSMLHSSAFNECNAIPTTSMITEAAHSSALVGRPPYPSHFLRIDQIQHAIIQLGFSPAITNGELVGQFFTTARFANTCAAYLRSGYPLLIGGVHGDGVPVGHAVCAVGFREPAPQQGGGIAEVSLQDDNISYLYIHDDNIGPNVRFKLITQKVHEGTPEEFERCVMKMETPAYLNVGAAENLDNTTIIPQSIIAAVHPDLKITSDSFFRHGISLTGSLHAALKEYTEGMNIEPTSLVFSTRFVMLKDYLSIELKRQLGSEPDLLSNTRIQLQENVPPMSLHLALLRIAMPDASVLIDVLFDTTDTDKNRSVFCHVVYDLTFANFLDVLQTNVRERFLGVFVKAYK